MNLKNARSSALLALVALAFLAWGQSGPAAPSLTRAMKDEAATTLGKKLAENYVFPEMGKKMEALLKELQAKPEYEAAAEGPAFAKYLTDQLQALSKDKHLRVRFHPNALPADFGRGRPPTPEDEREEERMMKRENGGFEKVERLPGNVGYVDFRFFGEGKVCYEAALAAMRFLQNSDAIIFDVRQNGGGSPAMVAFICSFLLDSGVHLNDLYFRPDNETRQFWTLPSMPVERYLTKPVYVLTSSRTFSGAEEFSYNLKTQKRATLVGETTGGGAHPGGGNRLGDHFTAFIPVGRAINPITKTNWEGTGVKPDIEVKADDALITAHRNAVKKLLDAATSQEDKEWLTRVLDRIK